VSIYGQPREPDEVVDRILWRDAQLMLGRHKTAGGSGDCAWCRQPFPCEAYQLAERALAVAYEPVG
jgi:hypothetical protein